MPAPKPLGPERIGIDRARLGRVLRRLESWTGSGRAPAAALCVGRGGGALEPEYFGRMGPEDDAPAVRPDALFLVASLTKPLTATAVMILAEHGEVGLDDRVAEFLPDFARNGKHDVRLRHLLTHTSGLPDMLPDNRALRAAHAPLERFVGEVMRLPLRFPPGTQVSYQSTGFAVLGEVGRVVSGVGLAEFLRREVFEPLGMADTSLGWRPEHAGRIVRVRLEPDQEGTDWHWNTPYWLGFGAPWGGLITSPADYARFCRMMLNHGALDGTRVLSPAAVRAMTSNQLEGMPSVPETDRRCRPWGLGWRLTWRGESAHFGDLLGPRAYGHWGATGTLCWVDPDADAFLVLLTTQPGGDDGGNLARLSNAFAAAFVGAESRANPGSGAGLAANPE
jgi:CubicO group peptidase (beta-lactamase class C family)